MFLLYWLIAIMPLEQHDIWGRELIGHFTVVKLLGTLVLLFALVRAFTKYQWPSLRDPISKCAWGFLALLYLNYLFNEANLVNAAMAYSHVISITALVIATGILVRTPVQLHRCILASIGAVGFVSLHAIRQWQLYGWQRGFRPSGMLADSNYFALVAALWMPVMYLWAITPGRPRWERVYCLVCFATSLLGSTLAASRGGFLGLVLAFAFILLHSTHRIRNLAFATLVILPVLLFAPISPVNRLLHPDDIDQGSKHARLAAWEGGFHMIAAHPLGGVGLHNFKPLMANYTPPGEQIVSLAHNTYIELAAEIGIPGLAAFMALLAAVIYVVDSIRRRAFVRHQRYIMTTALGLEAGVLSFVVTCLFLSAWWDKLAWMLICCAIALQSTARRSLRRQRSSKQSLYLEENGPVAFTQDSELVMPIASVPERTVGNRSE